MLPSNIPWAKFPWALIEESSTYVKVHVHVMQKILYTPVSAFAVQMHFTCVHVVTVNSGYRLAPMARIHYYRIIKNYCWILSK